MKECKKMTQNQIGGKCNMKCDENGFNKKQENPLLDFNVIYNY